MATDDAACMPVSAACDARPLNTAGNADEPPLIMKRLHEQLIFYITSSLQSRRFLRGTCLASPDTPVKNPYTPAGTIGAVLSSTGVRLMRGIEQQRTNSFIEAMPVAVRERLYPQLELVWMKMGESLSEPVSRSGHVYFPVTAVVSIVYVMQDGASGEVALVGNEGMLGVSLFMGGQSRFTRAIVQSAGFVFRLRAQHLIDEFNRTGPMLELLLRYSQALSTQTLQIAACNRRHRIDQQLCRWLLSSLDRMSTDELEITQEFLATILGVRREAVTIAARKLQDDGLIHCRRAHIRIIDRDGLEKRACECYHIVRSECSRLLPTPANMESGRFLHGHSQILDQRPANRPPIERGWGSPAIASHV